jgi:aspartate dehydrogenase
MIRIGVIGCGAIGTAVALTIQKKFSRFARLVYLTDLNPSQVQRLCRKLKGTPPRRVSLETLVGKSDLIIEAASVAAACEAVPQALRLGKRIMVLSVGGILKIKNLSGKLKKSRGTIYVPSGAISGVDGVLAARRDHIRSVKITTRKPLSSLKDSPFFKKQNADVRTIRKPKLIFEGNALQAIHHFPENVNVAATLSLGGIGPRRTRVRVYASPTYRYNQHEIEVEGGFGKIVSSITNVPSRGNRKTSQLAISSAIATLEKIFDQVKVGT